MHYCYIFATTDVKSGKFALLRSTHIALMFRFGHKGAIIIIYYYIVNKMYSIMSSRRLVILLPFASYIISSLEYDFLMGSWLYRGYI